MRMDTRKYYEERILRVQMYIQEHLDEDISLEDLAEVACFPPFISTAYSVEWWGSL